MERAGAWLLVVLGAVSPTAAADPRLAYFEGFDRDRDGRVALVEYQDYFSAGFDALDRNADGRLDADELPHGRQRSPSRDRMAHRRAVQRTFVRLDRNRDGWLSPDELTAPP